MTHAFCANFSLLSSVQMIFAAFCAVYRAVGRGILFCRSRCDPALDPGYPLFSAADGLH